MSAPALAALLPGQPSAATVRRLLGKMREARMVHWCPQGWFLLDASPDALDRAAEVYGKLGHRDEQVARLEADREARRCGNGVDLLAPPMGPGEAASLTEGITEPHLGPAPVAAVMTSPACGLRPIAGSAGPGGDQRCSLVGASR